MAMSESTVKPITAGIIGALVGGLLTAGGFAVVGGENESPGAREFTAQEEGEEEAEPTEVASGLTLSYAKGKFTAKVASEEPECLASRAVTVFQGRKKIGSLTTDSAGIGTLAHRRADGRYHGKVAESEFTGEYGELNTCLAAVSTKITV